MRFLFLGAGAIGTYVGGSLAAAGEDVTFIERPETAEAIAAHGLRVRTRTTTRVVRDVTVHGTAGRVLRVVNEFIVLAFALAFLWGGWLFMQRAAHFSTAALAIPNWLYYMPATLGMVLFALVAVVRVVRALQPEATAVQGSAP